MKKQRILLITRNLPPLVGGMERLNWHMADELSKYHQVTVIAPKGSKALKPANVDIIEVPLKPLFLFLWCAFFKGFVLTLKLQPKVLLAGSGLTAPLVWLLAKLNHAKAIAYLHGLDITANQMVYRLLWRSRFKRLDRVIVNSSPTKALAMQAGVAAEKLDIVSPGVSIPDTMQPQDSIHAFKQQHGLVGKKILLSVGRLTTRKGLKEFVENSLLDIVQSVPETVLVVVGEAPKNSLGASIQTIDSIQQSATLHNVAAHILFLGVIIDPQQLAIVYEAADIHVFPVRYIPDDPEGFGMVAVEAAAHGTPTVAFATGGVVDAVAEGVSGYLVEKNNYSQLSKQVITLLANPLPKENIQDFARQFEWVSFGSKLCCLTILNDQD
ncbi:glycosyltransferase family 4 protein [Acinetobacter schindleri]|uniref:glycosyltransferase family 4 protein n=1 Tax=Acinetobacter schindleri TaxID=108981 RepID=UPI002FE37D0A